jgi:carboxypeptidase C (cathepsin A)
MIGRLFAGFGLAAILGMASAAGAASIPPHGDRTVVTRHQVTLAGKPFKYTAYAGQIPLLVNDTGERMGTVFFIAYMADRKPGAPKRPVTFLWNGGPGSNAAQIHFMGFGPKRPKTADLYPDYGPDTETPLADNAETWLQESDLVFIDPPGTGFSRATTIPYRDVLYTSRGDAEATAETIRIVLNRFDDWDAPLVIGGESYGTTRAMLVAEALEKRRTHVGGVILISGGYNAGQKVPQPLNQALAITEFTAAAHYHHRLPPDLQALSEAEAVKRAEAWARTTYAPALARRDQLTDAERAEVLAGLARFTAVDGKVADQKTLTLSSAEFYDHLLADRGLELGRYDARVTVRARPAGQPWLPTGDPSLQRMADLMNGTSRVFNGYVRRDLGFESDLLYRGPFGGAFHPEPLNPAPGSGLPSDWMSAMFKIEGGALGDSQAGEPPLKQAMEQDPRLQVLAVRGQYDGSCAQLDEAVARTDPALRARVAALCLPAGHMVYSDLPARRTLRQAYAAFLRRVEAAH